MKDDKNNSNPTSMLPLFLCMGISIGTAVGIAMDNVGVGMCLGLGIGSLLGAVLGLSKKNDEEEEKR